jgi:hypothetical protein
MENNQRMITWSAAWALIGGIVVCTGCMNSQTIKQCEEPFPHEPGCKAKDEVTERPWAELHQILDDERG